jgi:hypothetical protein
MRLAFFLLFLGLAACRAEEKVTEPHANSVEELDERLGKLSNRMTEDIEPPRRLAYLREADLGPEWRVQPSCRLHQQGRLLLVVNDAGAVARVDGRRVQLAVAAPVGPTGGFFTAPGITASVGRIAPFAGYAGDPVRGWPARVTIGGDKERPIEKHEADWICTR